MSLKSSSVTMFRTFEPVDEILKCDHWNESYWAALSYGTDWCAGRIEGGSNFWVCGLNPELETIQMKPVEQKF